MNIRKAITKETVSLRLVSREKNAIIEELVDLLDKAGRISDRKAVLKCVLEREKKMSTGMHNGLAIPHGKTDTVDGLVAAVGLIPEGVDFESMDQQPARIFILTVSPANRAGPHIQFLAEISRLMNRADARKQILEADSLETLHALLTET
ncbi:MAG: PTS sugar transporter subunit IIA [Verrucomicrobia bacterium]|nr:PTS sugar transporter subunit IIA [Verrucomicrobiota bacterium]MCH8527286.1 PTS sugar transporter subunit IIA [Kiritimatiellia bacterium]